MEGVESYGNNFGSGFGEVMTSFYDESTNLEEVSIDHYEEKFLSMMIIVMTRML